MVKKLFRFLLVFLLILFSFAVLLFDIVDNTPYKEMPYYKEMSQQLDTLSIPVQAKTTIKVGWASVNFTPDFPVSLTSYGRTDPFESVHDSVFVRAFTFDNGQNKAAIITIDLLIVPPSIVKGVEARIIETGFSSEDLYFSATHTHNGPGGWSDIVAGRFLSGPYFAKMEKRIIDAVLDAISKASLNAELAEIGFGREEAETCIVNRLVAEGHTDPWLRSLIIRKKSGSTAVLSVFSAHATCLSHKENVISCDYPGVLVRGLEKEEEIDFAAFCAGAMGSMAPGAVGFEGFEKAEAIGDTLSRKLLKSMNHIEMEDSLELSNFHLPVLLRAPHLRISDYLRIRPWVFNWLMEKQDVRLSCLKLGNTVFIGTPCDFSGELVKEFDGLAESKNIDLVITSFNGGYIGYITPDKYYYLEKSETREMNWFGPYNGAYFTEIISRVLEKVN